MDDTISAYHTFLERKRQSSLDQGLKATWMPAKMFPFQQELTTWALRRGRAALFEECGLGKSIQMLTWAENIVRQTNQRVLILTPLAVGAQMAAEGEKFGIACARSRSGALGTHRILIANYEQLHHFQPQDFIAVGADESAIIKHFSGMTQQNLTRFMSKIPYRLLCTATPAPNDYIELGTAAEALGEMGYSDMLGRFFRQDDGKAFRMNEVKLSRPELGNHYAKLSYRIAQQIGQWRLKGHAEGPFWQWVASWARACRKPSDLGYADDGYVLPPMTERLHLIEASRPADGMLFTLPAFGLSEEREERRRTMTERCEAVAKLVDHDQPAIIWCHLNEESHRLSQMIPDGEEITGSQGDDLKEERIMAFIRGELRVLISKPVLCGWGLNLQHCAHVVTFVGHSFEQDYQTIRRCYRFGQTRPVIVDRVATTGEQRVIDNLQRKSQQATMMFDRIMGYMQQATQMTPSINRTGTVEIPSWIS